MEQRKRVRTEASKRTNEGRTVKRESNNVRKKKERKRKQATNLADKLSTPLSRALRAATAAYSSSTCDFHRLQKQHQ
jgi:hypothetical protein